MLAHELKKVLNARGISARVAPRASCDISDAGQVSRLFQTHRPSLLLNCAAHTGVDLCEDEPGRANAINGTGVKYLAEQSREYGTQLVHFSTDFVFDGQNDVPYRPNDCPSPLSAYGRSKLLGETAIQEITPPAWLIVRTSWLFGRHGNCFPKVIVDRARAGHVLKVVSDQQGCPTYAVDLASAVLEMVDRHATGIWHLTNDCPTNWFEFARSIVTEFNIPTEVTPISTAQWVAMRPKQAKRPAYSVLDGSAYADLTGKRMRNWHDALVDYRTECEKGS
jgi:dTDP-4-dehydrorhamnose reductase